MLNKTPLTERYQNILRATIQHYIATAEPVGSKTLLEEYKFRISSATIRNALGSLEKAGLLYQPHVSAGRIPSDSGYRIYVDQLLIFNEIKKEKIGRSLQQQLTSQGWSIESLLQRATQILANLSGYIALITFPQTTTIQLRHLQLIQVSSGQVMIIIVTDAYQTHSILMDLPQNTDANQEDFEEELQILSNFLNSQLKGRTLSELSTLNWQEIDQNFASYRDFLKTLLKKLEPLLQSTAPMVIHGVSEVIRQPEFSQLEQVQMLLRLLEQEQDQLFPLIFELPDRENVAKSVSVRIGAENPLESMRPCTLVSALYHQGDVPVGSVGIIGPTRMLYEQTIPLVESTANYLSEALS
jgi:heat-inducible transcriptional repressor